MKQAALLFVYNADSGLFNLLADIGHKIFSPDTYACELCMLTHGYFSENKAWRHFIDALDCDCRFMHRDEFATAPGVSGRRSLPDVLPRRRGDRVLSRPRDAAVACARLLRTGTAPTEYRIINIQ